MGRRILMCAVLLLPASRAYADTVLPSHEVTMGVVVRASASSEICGGGSCCRSAWTAGRWPAFGNASSRRWAGGQARRQLPPAAESDTWPHACSGECSSGADVARA